MHTHTKTSVPPTRCFVHRYTWTLQKYGRYLKYHLLPNTCSYHTWLDTFIHTQPLNMHCLLYTVCLVSLIQFRPCPSILLVPPALLYARMHTFAVLHVMINDYDCYVRSSNEQLREEMVLSRSLYHFLNKASHLTAFCA